MGKFKIIIFVINVRLVAAARLRRTTCVKRYLQSSLEVKYGGDPPSQMYEALNQIEVASSLRRITLHNEGFFTKVIVFLNNLYVSYFQRTIWILPMSQLLTTEVRCA